MELSTTKHASPLLQPPLLRHSTVLTPADLGLGSQQLDCTLTATRQPVRSTGSNRGFPTSDCSLMNGENESNICPRKFHHRFISDEPDEHVIETLKQTICSIVVISLVNSHLEFSCLLIMVMEEDRSK